LLDTQTQFIITRTVLTIPFRKHPNHLAVCLSQRYRLFWLETGQRTSASWGCQIPLLCFSFRTKYSTAIHLKTKLMQLVFIPTHISCNPCTFFPFWCNSPTRA